MEGAIWLMIGITVLMGIGLGLYADSDRLKAMEFCEANLYKWSNASEIYKMQITETHIGCSDGQNIMWYDKQFYLEHRMIMPLYN